MLRAELLGDTPSELLGAVTGITEARFPVHAESHFSDGFTSRRARTPGTPQTLVGTTIYSQPGAPVIAVQDGESCRSAAPRPSGTSSRCATLRQHLHVRRARRRLARIPGAAAAFRRQREPPGSRTTPRMKPRRAGPASAGAQPRSPLSEAEPFRGSRSEPARHWKAAGAKPASDRRRRRALPRRSPAPDPRCSTKAPRPCTCVRWPPASQVIAGTVLGHVGAEGTGATQRRSPAHALPDPSRGRGSAADRPEADPRRLGRAREHVGVQGQGREPVPYDIADGRTGPARVKAAASAAGAPGQRDHPVGMRAPGHQRGQGRQARPGDARVPVGVGRQADRCRRLLHTLEGTTAAGLGRRRRRGGHHRGRRRARSRATRARERSPTARSASS